MRESTKLWQKPKEQSRFRILDGRRKILGAVASPSDVRKGRKKMIEEMARDLDPSQREAVKTIIENWREGASEDELRRLLGEKRSGRILKELRSA
jgi:hypothetical protein